MNEDSINRYVELFFMRYDGSAPTQLEAIRKVHMERIQLVGSVLSDEEWFVAQNRVRSDPRFNNGG